MNTAQKVTRRSVAASMLVLATILVAGCGSSDIYLVRTPNLFTGKDAADPFTAVPECHRSCDINVLYGTDRSVEEAEKGKRIFGYNRSMALEYGTVKVNIGGESSWADLVAASRSGERKGDLAVKVTDVQTMGQFPESNQPPVFIDGVPQDTPEVAKQNAESTAKLQARLKEELAKSPRKEVFMYVHGYNNSFDEAAVRMSMLWHFMGRQGVPVIYTWPAGSGGLLRGYTRDRESGEFTVFHLKQFLRAVADCPEVEKIHLISHSRGTDVTMTALRELFLEHKHAPGSVRSKLKLGQLVLAAPDLDWDVFNQRVISERMGGMVENITVYVSPNDKAIGMAEWLFQSGHRLGTLAGGKTVDADWQSTLKHMKSAAIVNVQCDTIGMGHAYFVDSPEVLSDMILVLRDGKKPGKENGRPLEPRDDGFWNINNGYPNGPVK